MTLNFPSPRLLACIAALLAGHANAQTNAQSLPPEVEAALARAKVPREALAAVVVDAAPAIAGKSAPLFSWREIGRASCRERVLMPV